MQRCSRKRPRISVVLPVAGTSTGQNAQRWSTSWPFWCTCCNSGSQAVGRWPTFVQEQVSKKRASISPWLRPLHRVAPAPTMYLKWWAMGHGDVHQRGRQSQSAATCQHLHVQTGAYFCAITSKHVAAKVAPWCLQPCCGECHLRPPLRGSMSLCTSNLVTYIEFV